MPFSPKRLGDVAYSMVMFIVVSVLAGVLVAGLFVPLAGFAGVSSKAAAEELNNLPAELQVPPQAERTRVLLADGSTLAYFYDENRVYVPLAKIAPVMRQAQLAIEDHRFYEHGALDFKATLRAFVRNQAADGVSQGGSTITQQYVKMVQVENCQANGDEACVRDVQAATYERKIRELRYAIAVEKQLSKDQILERYLNIAYYGEGAYGVEAAARHYFSTNAAKLTLAQAAMLAGLVQNPDANNPVKNLSAALDRRDVVVNRMVELNFVTPEQAKAAKATTFDKKKIKATRSGCVDTRYPFLCDFVFRTLRNTESLGATVEARENMIKRGGLTIKTAIDPDSQDKAEKSVAAVVDPKDPVISTMNMIQPGTGLIVAMAQSRPVMGSDAKKGETYWNYSVTPDLGGIQGYQAGSTFKAFTAAAALEKGIPLNKVYNAQRTMDFSGRSYESCRGEEQVYGSWRVSNSTGTNGVMNMMLAAQRSVNTYFVQLELDTGMCRVTEMAKKLGVKLGTPDRDLVDFYQDKPSFTLGSVEVSPLSMAEAYATFAARGIHCDPIIVDKIITGDGKELAAPNANCQRVLDKDVADGVNKLLGSVMTRGTGQRAATSDGRPQAGKTGTIDSNEAVWFAGYTPEIAGVAMISIDNQKKPFQKGKPGFRRSGVKNYRLPTSGTFLEGSGSGDAGMKIWKPTMERYLRNVPATDFNEPSGNVENGKQVDLPKIEGMGVRDATEKLEKAGFTVSTRFIYSTQPAGTFLGFSPSSGSTVEFGTVYKLTSNGREDPAVVAERERQAAEQRAAAERARAEEARKKAEAEARKAEAEAKKRNEEAAKRAEAEAKRNGG
ncbi:MAG TPA: transglycosylase domain-containing protein [Propionibacteriaceae bacterium]|nr:transglycosylase domain-containing protein [Propionibacteriaceae bacterium]